MKDMLTLENRNRIDRHPITVELSVIQNLTGVNKNIAVSVTKVTCLQ